VLIFSKLEENKEEKKLLNQFALNYLRPDLILVLKLLATNVNAMVVSELIKRLWDAYLRSLKKHDLKRLDSVNESDTEDMPRFPKKDNDSMANGASSSNLINSNLNKQYEDSESKQLLADAATNSKRPSNA